MQNSQQQINIDEKEKQRKSANFKANTAKGRFGNETFQPIGEYILPAEDRKGNLVGGHVIPPYSCLEGKKCVELTKSTVAYVNKLGDELLNDENTPNAIGGYLKWIAGKFEFNTLFAAGYRPDIDTFISHIKENQGNPEEQARILNQFQLEVAVNSYTGVAALAASQLVTNLNPELFQKFAPDFYAAALENYRYAQDIYNNKDNLYYNDKSKLLLQVRDSLKSKTPEESESFAQNTIKSIEIIPNNNFSNVTNDPDLASSSVKSLNKIAAGKEFESNIDDDLPSL